jgi:hypothetical protein
MDCCSTVNSYLSNRKCNNQLELLVTFTTIFEAWLAATLKQFVGLKTRLANNIDV